MATDISYSASNLHRKIARRIEWHQLTDPASLGIPLAADQPSTHHQLSR
ncbi:hypothetical protein ACFQ6B_06530 [Streptomyces wedmorensis]|uniref:Transposase n=1 Tax=Streptomyces wedmorensis TaxID=43759 RepID=A0ABW6IZB3_STRWE